MAIHSLELACMVAMLCMLVLNPMATASLSCDDVETELDPCVDYLFSSGTENKDECCEGVRALNERARDKADRQEACQCIKNQLGGWRALFITEEIKSLVEALPQQCGVDFKISATADCNK
ncbi:Plant lipid transfer protein/Par allergen [Corchorus capsularis]|uniref:Non-specific lipid-transfer protein n=1 Tax=Corchorus capsularis TaxID=210143 RepID=A0A1R3KFP0_COCAP|nr:Plant lipid transfer protein/Par allergen [Corchorus capsularis]